MGRWVGLAALLLPVMASFGGCSGNGDIEYATVRIELTYPEPMTLPTGAHAEAALRLTGAPADPLMKTGRHDAGDIIAHHETAASDRAPPISVTLRYPRAALDPTRAAVIDAWIVAGDQVLFAVTESPRLQTRGSGPVRVTMRRPRHVTLACADGSRPAAALPMMGDLAFLETAGTPPVVLRAVPVAHGVRYDGDGYALRARGDEVLLARPAVGDTRCEATPSSQPLPVGYRP